MSENLDHYLKLWNVSDPDLIATTNTSFVYKVNKGDELRVLKLYKDAGKEDEAIGPPFLSSCQGNGAVGVYEYDDKAALIEFIDGPQVKTLVEQGRDEEATRIIGQTLAKIHQNPVPKSHSFELLEHRVRKLFVYATADAPDIIKRAAAFAPELLENQTDISLVHGDMHHENVLLHETRGWLAIDPKGIVGDRAYDCANTLYNPLGRPDLTQNKGRLLKQVHLLSEELGIDPQRIINYAYVYGCLSSCWSLEDDGQYGEEVLKTSALLEPLVK